MHFLMLYFTIGYSLINVLDHKASGAMVIAYLPEGRPVWLDQIRDRFLHPTSESLATYANTILGDDGGDDLDDVLSPTREEKKKVDKSEKKEKVEEPVTGVPRKQPSNFSLLDYVVVSDTLSSLDAGDKRAERDPDDDATLTEIEKKKKALEDKKKELDEQAAAALAEKKSRSQKETTAAPSESKVDLSVFSVKPRNLLEKIYKSASGSRGVKSGKGARKVDISKITPPTSPPSKTFDLSPPHDDPGKKRKEDHVDVEQVGEGAAVGAGAGGGNGAGDGGGDRGGGVDVEVESSKTTSHYTIYTRVVRGSGESGASGTDHSPEYEHVQGGSWDTHNPACADLPNAPRWNLTQGSRMTDLGNCREFFSLSLPLLKDCFRKDAIRCISWMIISIWG
ncbi:hypothetical protein HanRHA438_Chr10g0447681 [Helianthus annuus]|uniref:Uncharacterized protein n=1 Tax=Helianthus annuus TaxID=4232 RepID=A0A9K3HX23_HELAN|nr:hypothetical protein HanXRQr2_Chr10g0435561 [Helianthus annuus]KAJ0513474.1 hypothetical protein HanHA300_Chr10g0358001 [Helianthus annuus]KAJ0529589.1 hypothetical protein HanHA89_Chr10g0379611 [Helianthus annuus]KAJ0696474.1 hypothetical protein HanLR1_Chr10g0357521 [Helianthus annuus]KAJ0879121.1 hypothetical protein HanRHA438_Chr10g0447681 [Helianthus annuus]